MHSDQQDGNPCFKTQWIPTNESEGREVVCHKSNKCIIGNQERGILEIRKKGSRSEGRIQKRNSDGSVIFGDWLSLSWFWLVDNNHEVSCVDNPQLQNKKRLISTTEHSSQEQPKKKTLKVIKPNIVASGTNHLKATLERQGSIEISSTEGVEDHNPADAAAVHLADSGIVTVGPLSNNSTKKKTSRSNAAVHLNAPGRVVTVKQKAKGSKKKQVLTIANTSMGNLSSTNDVGRDVSSSTPIVPQVTLTTANMSVGNVSSSMPTVQLMSSPKAILVSNYKDAAVPASRESVALNESPSLNESPEHDIGKNSSAFSPSLRLDALNIEINDAVLKEYSSTSESQEETISLVTSNDSIGRRLVDAGVSKVLLCCTLYY